MSGASAGRAGRKGGVTSAGGVLVGVVVGAGVHLSGHTVERGIVRTAPVRLATNTTVGVSTHVEIDVETGPGCQIGSLSMVPKGSRLEANAVYVGCPVHKLDRKKSPEAAAT